MNDFGIYLLKMLHKYSHAIVERISDSIVKECNIDINLAKRQHENFCCLLREIGLDVIELPPHDFLAGGVFVENTSVICNGVALIGRSNCALRQRETESVAMVMRKELAVPTIAIDDDGALLDGGDVLFTGREFFVGMSNLTNAEGARALASTFPEYPVTPIKVSGDKRLKYYITMAGPNVLSVSTSKNCQEIVKRMEREATYQYQKITLPEELAANMIYVNGTLVHRSPDEIPLSYKVIKEKIDTPTRNINISEFSQFSNGLTSACLLVQRWKKVREL